MRLKIAFVYRNLYIYGVKNSHMIWGRIVWNDCWLFIFLKQARDSSRSPVNIAKIRRYHIEYIASQYISKCWIIDQMEEDKSEDGWIDHKMRTK